MEILNILLSRGMSVQLKTLRPLDDDRPVRYQARIDHDDAKIGSGDSPEAAIVCALSAMVIHQATFLRDQNNKMAFWGKTLDLMKAYYKANHEKDTAALIRLGQEALSAIYLWNQVGGSFPDSPAAHQFKVDPPLAWMTEMPPQRDEISLVAIEDQDQYEILYDAAEINERNETGKVVAYAPIPVGDMQMPTDAWLPISQWIRNGEYLVFLHGDMTAQEHRDTKPAYHTAWGFRIARYKGGWKELTDDEVEAITHFLPIPPRTHD